MTFTTIATSIRVLEDKNTNLWVCFQCAKPINKPYLEVQYGQIQQLYCSKCAPATLDAHLGMLEFIKGEVKRLHECFPKKKKDKHDDINIVATL